MGCFAFPVYGFFKSSYYILFKPFLTTYFFERACAALSNRMGVCVRGSGGGGGLDFRNSFKTRNSTGEILKAMFQAGMPWISVCLSPCLLVVVFCSLGRNLLSVVRDKNTA